MSNHENLSIADLQLDDENSQEHHYFNLTNEEIALETELERLQKINDVIDLVCDGLDKGKENMELLLQTVDNANKLLDLWTRVLSQTEHTQRLILNGRWRGATQDLLDIEAETQARKLKAQREREERAAAAERARFATIKEEEEKAKGVDKRNVGRGRGRGLPSVYRQNRPGSVKSTCNNETLTGTRGTGISRGIMGRSNSTHARAMNRGTGATSRNRPA